jgi:N-acetyl-beta-hexosaminidase
MKKITSILAILLFTLNMMASEKKNTANLIPVPVHCKMGKGEFTFSPQTEICLTSDNPEMRNAIALLSERLERSAGFRLNITSKANSSHGIICRINSTISNKERYKLQVTPHRIEVMAATPAGIFYAMQTIRQLLPAAIDKDSLCTGVKWSIPCVEIEDYPRYPYRGLMLDVCRHFFPVSFVKKYIDYLAYHKMNRFHWHLTDDQGWRIEIKKYPKLTEASAFRERTLIGHYSDKPRRWDISHYGGYYTQDQIREVIAYAQKRFVTIIPEIEMPGHAEAALAAYPNLSCSGGPFEVVGDWGIRKDIYCTREETFQFIQDVLSEVAALFPSEYIHIGGDEAPKLRWSRCFACQERIKKEGLKDEHELQSYFIRRMEDFLQTKGKRIIGWDEILEGGLAPNATVMSWRGTEGGIAAARQHHDVIMTPLQSVYLDHYQSKSKDEPLAIGGYLPLKNVYSFEPTPSSLKPEEAAHILGVQGNLWTEYIATEQYAEYMAFPRAAAIAETAWSPKGNKDWDAFLQRLNGLLLHYDAMGINYSRSFRNAE